jgi:WD40 repeat protein
MKPLDGLLLRLLAGVTSLATSHPSLSKEPITLKSQVTLESKEAVHCVRFSPDGKALASAGSDGCAVVWDLAKAEKRMVLAPGEHPLRAVAFSPDGKQVATARIEKDKEYNQFGVVRFWDAATGKELRGLKGELSRIVLALAFSPDGNKVAVGGYTPFRVEETKGRAQVWDVSKQQLIQSLDVKIDPITTVAFSPDGDLLATGAGQGALEDGEVTIWEVATGKPKQTLKTQGPAFAVDFSPDGKTLATGSGGLEPVENARAKIRSELKLWEVASGKAIRALKGSKDGVRCLAFSPDGKLLASGGGTFFIEDRGELNVWDVPTGKEVLRLEGHNRDVSSVAFSPDSRTLASASSDKTIKLWDVAKALEGREKK